MDRKTALGASLLINSNAMAVLAPSPPTLPMATHKLDLLGFSSVLSFSEPDWSTVPERPGVYAILDGDEVVYVGMAGRNGKGSLRRRLADHSSGQVVNMFTQYLLFDRMLPLPDPPRTPGEAKGRCRA